MVILKHNVKISVSKKPRDSGIVKLRRLTVREKLLKWLFGRKEKLLLVVPGSSVEAVSIVEVPEGGEDNG